jgi:hypothetical protein
MERRNRQDCHGMNFAAPEALSGEAWLQGSKLWHLKFQNGICPQWQSYAGCHKRHSLS